MDTMNNASNEYRLARKRGQKQYHDDLRRGVSPYPKVLDEILADQPVAGRTELGIFDIPIDRIVGTVTAGRRTAFSTGFMPLLEEQTEFGMKWISLCADHLGTTGIREPIRCYEYLGEFYVQEGNKRVSVLRYFGATSVSASVLRIVPAWEDTPRMRIYYEFLEFFHSSRLYAIRFHREGQYRKLVAALGFPPEHIWTAEEQQAVQSLFTRFTKASEGIALPSGATVEDAFLNFLCTYSIDEIRQMSSDALHSAIAASAAEVDASVSVSLEMEPVEKSVFGRLYDAVFLPDTLKAAFIHALSPETSDWIAAHEEGRRYAEQEFGGKVTTTAYFVSETESADALMSRAVKEGAQVIFATTPSLMTACRRAAAAYPQIKILNCSVIMPYPGVRTYYSRIYEAKYISGAIAGAMSETGRLGYIASSPIFGVPAGINAFALGARLTNPRARVKLRWSCVDADPLKDLIDAGVDVISNRDLPMPSRPQAHWGLNRVKSDHSLQPLLAPYWNWGEFYRKLLGDILQGHWEDNAFGSAAQAVNYWWGMQSGVVDFMMPNDLPEGVQTLAKMLKKELSGESLLPFFRTIVAQDGTVQSDGTRLFSPQEILRMDWLCDSVDGEIPPFERVLPMAQSIVRLEGIYRDTLPPQEEPNRS